MIVLIALLIIVLLVPYLNKIRSNRELDRRERLQDKQEQLMEFLRKKKKEDDENSASRIQHPE